MNTIYGRRGPALLPSVIAAGTNDAGGGNVGEDATRPFVLGYIDAAQLLDESAIAEVRARLGEYAIAARLQLGSIYVDQPDAGGSMFRALLAAIERYNPAHVLVPSLDHVAALVAVAETKQQRIESRTNATIRPVGT
ncbi:hypothetical protein ACQPXM_41390 (plasmid) [Kribbella sp. CA-253562]|uniref:hypothetical protein n=1 Tax=Kribbella sp. CA-253562 TaxID=3239942 RepID=UPI003D8EAA08